ncbi:MAG TPA: PrpF domain-containing protein [Pilimelia sp.]|nr:PrpF domain-containing protein [Pilimelia sp.]
MTGHVAYAAGSPCPTLVLDAAYIPAATSDLVRHLAVVRRRLAAADRAHILKLAVVRPAAHPMYDLDYRFVQALPGGFDRFELRGSCGHSILATVAAAERMGLVRALRPGGRVRVNVLNNGDTVVCEVAARPAPTDLWFTVHFVQQRPVPLAELLIAGEPRTVLEAAGRRYEVSLVSSGNPYVFVDARTLGLDAAACLFAAGDAVHAELVALRRAAAVRLGWPPDGAFPKIAAVLPDGPGALAARALSVPSWHPTIALTGAVCLASAVRIPGTVPAGAAAEGGHLDDTLRILTAGGRTGVTTAVEPVAGEPALCWSSVAGKRVTLEGALPRPARRKADACC